MATYFRNDGANGYQFRGISTSPIIRRTGGVVNVSDSSDNKFNKYNWLFGLRRRQVISAKMARFSPCFLSLCARKVIPKTRDRPRKKPATPTNRLSADSRCSLPITVSSNAAATQLRSLLYRFRKLADSSSAPLLSSVSNELPA